MHPSGSVWTKSFFFIYFLFSPFFSSLFFLPSFFFPPFSSPFFLLPLLFSCFNPPFFCYLSSLLPSSKILHLFTFFHASWHCIFHSLHIRTAQVLNVLSSFSLFSPPFLWPKTNSQMCIMKLIPPLTNMPHFFFRSHSLHSWKTSISILIG